MEGGRGGKGGISCGTFHLNALPQDCVTTVLSLTTPRDACSLSLVSTTFRSAAESDRVWERFLPPEYQALNPLSLGFSSKKQLYLSLCPVLFDGGRKSFSLGKGSGKKCYMLSARELFIVWSSNPTYWRWVSIPESRFEEVAELIGVCWFEIRGRISISMLSPMTHYKAYLVFQATAESYGFDFQPVDVSVGRVGTEGNPRTALLIPLPDQQPVGGWLAFELGEFFKDLRRHSNVREDGWLEIELGEYINEACVDGELEMSVLAITGHWKSGIVVQGIEIRPNPSA